MMSRFEKILMWLDANYARAIVTLLIVEFLFALIVGGTIQYVISLFIP